MTTAFCDGISFKLGPVSKANVFATKLDLVSEIHNTVMDLNIKNLYVHSHQNVTYIWMTLSAETHELDSMMICRINKVLEAIKKFALCFWRTTEEDVSNFEITKLDITKDLKGAFLPESFDTSYNLLK